MLPRLPALVWLTLTDSVPGPNSSRLRVHHIHDESSDNLHRADSSIWSGHGRRYLKLSHNLPGHPADLTCSAVQTILPTPVPVHHLGMYREPSTLDPVEYYNNLPHHIPSSTGNSSASLAILVDPVIATGGTCAAAIQTLKEWGARKILVLSVIGAEEGVRKAAGEWPEGTELWIAGLDDELTSEGMLKPGLGDIGDRLFLTTAK